GIRDFHVTGVQTCALPICLVLEIRGDLWLAPDASDPTSLIRLTSGAALDIEPAWTADGRAVIFASDRAGGFDLWRLEVGPDGPRSEERRVGKEGTTRWWPG